MVTARAVQRSDGYDADHQWVRRPGALNDSSPPLRFSGGDEDAANRPNISLAISQKRRYCMRISDALLWTHPVVAVTSLRDRSNAIPTVLRPILSYRSVLLSALKDPVSRGSTLQGAFWSFLCTQSRYAYIRKNILRHLEFGYVG